MSIIEQLKNNERIYKYWTEEEKKEANKIGIKNFFIYDKNSYYRYDRSGYYQIVTVDKFSDDCNYRLSPDYQEEKLEYYEIKLDRGRWYVMYKGGPIMVHKIHGFEGFIGFLGEDGVIRPDFIYGLEPALENWRSTWTKELLESGKVIVKYGTHAVFKRENK